MLYCLKGDLFSDVSVLQLTLGYPLKTTPSMNKYPTGYYVASYIPKYDLLSTRFEEKSAEVY